ncbi:nuclear transport factor 2 family protein [Pediococcus pentosaceus]|uniref:nuclear transport factor 2 family protein n=1 Tax=Pediococcus pentosaceus TaxID=1255 RepID=UPI002017AE1B|nr:nuclear transport factor 2 family protein [Pediococcus pentosaceus]MCL3858656.1 nuclear transport factor 2 family protein [Pediococcus pentosaceus]MDE3750991.1 nuclear transport factor 2 family protein [Pediococcus pentosaceus]
MTKDEEQIVQLYRAENEAMVKKDISRLDMILGDRMTLTHMTGYVQPKLEWIDQIQNEEMQYLESKEEAIKDIRVEENWGQLTGQNLITAKIWGGSKNVWPLQMKMYFEKNNGRWVISKQVASTY